MTIAEHSTPWGYTIFCDDIRYEMNGKVSLIGVYAGDLIVSVPFPVMLPRLALRTSYFERPGESSDPVELRVFFPGDPSDAPSYRHQLTMEMVRSSLVSPELESPLLAIGHHYEFSPVLLKEQGAIRVRAYRGDLEVKMGSLQIRYQPPPTTAPPPPT